jgi:hypothetical protein|nr:MAG TPA: hypothetical protein [Caudoviricetes sp.]
MRNPYSLSMVQPSSNGPEVIKLTNIPPYDLNDWNLADQKDFKKFLSELEKSVRGSFEYQQYIQYLRNSFNMNSCAFYRNVSNVPNPKIKIHVHHDPITLYDICTIVFRKRQTLGEPIDEESIAKEVMWNHYNGFVGLIPLSETAHELVHANYLFVPCTHVFGDYKEFVNMYKQFFTLDQLDLLKDIEDASTLYTSDRAKHLFEQRFTYVDDSGAYDLPDKQKIIQMLNERKQELYNSL